MLKTPQTPSYYHQLPSTTVDRRFWIRTPFGHFNPQTFGKFRNYRVTFPVFCVFLRGFIVFSALFVGSFLFLSFNFSRENKTAQFKPSHMFGPKNLGPKLQLYGSVQSFVIAGLERNWIRGRSDPKTLTNSGFEWVRLLFFF